MSWKLFLLSPWMLSIYAWTAINIVLQWWLVPNVFVPSWAQSTESYRQAAMLSNYVGFGTLLITLMCVKAWGMIRVTEKG